MNYGPLSSLGVCMGIVYNENNLINETKVQESDKLSAKVNMIHLILDSSHFFQVNSERKKIRPRTIPSYQS